MQHSQNSNTTTKDTSFTFGYNFIQSYALYLLELECKPVYI